MAGEGSYDGETREERARAGARKTTNHPIVTAVDTRGSEGRRQGFKSLHKASVELCIFFFFTDLWNLSLVACWRTLL